MMVTPPVPLEPLVPPLPPKEAADRQLSGGPGHRVGGGKIWVCVCWFSAEKTMSAMTKSTREPVAEGGAAPAPGDYLDRFRQIATMVEVLDHLPDFAGAINAATNTPSYFKNRIEMELEVLKTVAAK